MGVSGVEEFAREGRGCRHIAHLQKGYGEFILHQKRRSGEVETGAGALRVRPPPFRPCADQSMGSHQQPEANCLPRFSPSLISLAR